MDKPKITERFMLALTLAFGLVVLAIAWFFLRRPIGIFYHISRSIETLGIWLLTPWGSDFHALSTGKGSASFLDIYTSSIPFGIFIAFCTLAIGYKLIAKTKSQHLSNFIAHDKNSPPDYKAVMRRQALCYPANQFFLDFPLTDFSDIHTGVARVPFTALDVIKESNAYNGTSINDGLEVLVCDRIALRNFLIPYLGRPNPFFSSGNQFTISGDPLPSSERIAQVINSELSWHHVLVLYPALYRLYGSLVDTGQEFSYFMNTTDQMLRDVWSDLVKLKSTLGASLVLGFQNEEDERYKRTQFTEKYGSEKTLFTFQEYLNEVIDGKKVADSLPTVIKARIGLIDILNAHRHQPDMVPVARDPKKGFIYKNRSEMKESERLFATRIYNQQMSFVKHIAPLLINHAYISTMLAAVLDEKTKGARSLGVLAPAQFRWMRFYDYKLWAFLRPIGGKTPVPEASGVFQHYQDEIVTSQAIQTPQVDRAIDAIINEANNYITPEKIAELDELKHRKQAADTHVSVSTSKAIHKATDELMGMIP